MSLIILTMKILDSDNDAPQLVHVNSCNLVPLFLLVRVKQVQKRKIVNWRALMIKQVTCLKLIKEPSNEPFLGTAGLNIVIDNPELVVEVVCSIIGDDRMQLLTEWSNLYHSQNTEKCSISPKALKSIITPEEMRKFLGLMILMGQVRKESIRDYCSTDPTVSTRIFPHTVSRNHFESIWQATILNPSGKSGILVTSACKCRIQGGYSKFDLCMNILYRNLGHFTAQNENCHFMKP